MGAEDPEQAILDKLAGPVGVWEPHSVSSGGIQSGLVAGRESELTWSGEPRRRR